MNAQHAQKPQKARLKRSQRTRHNRGPITRHITRAKKTIQFIYAHLPPAMVLVKEQHLRAQTHIEQRAQQRWFAGNSRPEDTLDNWLHAEREVVQELCEALLHRNIREPEPTPA
jgi:hypothetical protein